jgi:hypothetical protein
MLLRESSVKAKYPEFIVAFAISLWAEPQEELTAIAGIEEGMGKRARRGRLSLQAGGCR